MPLGNKAQKEYYVWEQRRNDMKQSFENLQNLIDPAVISEMSLKKGETLFAEGSGVRGLYYVNNGNIKLSKMGDDGRETIVRIAKEGELIGHMSVFSDMVYGTTAKAIEATTVSFIDKQHVIKLCQEQPQVAYKIMLQVSETLKKAQMRVASLTQKNVLERTCELLLFLKESHGEEKEGHYEILLHLNREEMASMVGTATETLIRTLSELRQENVIREEKRHIILLDEAFLRRYAGKTE